MNEAQATLELPRTRYRIAAELESAYAERDAYGKLLAEWAGLDMRSFVIFPDGRMEKIGEHNPPPNLAECFRTASERVVNLSYELYCHSR